MENRLFTSESVTEGHPDKVCDQVSDAVLDAILAIEPEAHVACEVSATTGMIVLMGEISANALNHVDSPFFNVLNMPKSFASLIRKLLLG